MFCTKCGRQLSESARFCPGCGSPVKQTETPEKPVPAGAFEEPEAAREPEPAAQAPEPREPLQPPVAEKPVEAQPQPAAEPVIAQAASEPEVIVTPEPPPAPKPAGGRRCGQCGVELSAASIFCPSCGMPNL